MNALAKRAAVEGRESKPCVRCGVDKLLTEYYLGAPRADGTRITVSECKICRIKVSGANGKRNLARCRDASRRFRTKVRYRKYKARGGRVSLDRRRSMLVDTKMHRPLCPPEPDTCTLPGTLGRLEVYRERAANRERVTHSDDARCFGDLSDTTALGKSSYYGN